MTKKFISSEDTRPGDILSFPVCLRRDEKMQRYGKAKQRVKNGERATLKQKEKTKTSSRNPWRTPAFEVPCRQCQGGARELGSPGSALSFSSSAVTSGTGAEQRLTRLPNPPSQRQNLLQIRAVPNTKWTNTHAVKAGFSFPLTFLML